MYQDVLRFWFEEISSAQWWKVDTEFDRLITQRYATVHLQATRGELFEWRARAEGRLAEIIVLDQFSRNLYRAQPGAFAADSMALALAQEAVAGGADLELAIERRSFIYMPYMHSESALIHIEAERLFKQHTSENSYAFEMRHKAIIDRFGRYPHRNGVLGRDSSAQEIAFLAGPGSSF